jgi:hypothetical protein
VTPSVGCGGSGCLSAWGCGVHATDEPRESVSDRLVAVKKVDSAIQLWSKMQIADADRLSKIKSNVQFQKYSPLHTPRSHLLELLTRTNSKRRERGEEGVIKWHLPALCQTLIVACTDRSLCSDITASLMQHLMMVMRTQGQLEQDLQLSREAQVNQDLGHAQALALLETTNSRLEGELKQRSNEVHVEQKLPDENHRQLCQEGRAGAKEQRQNTDARWHQTAQDELLLQLHTAEVASTKECRHASSAFYPLPFAFCPVSSVCLALLLALPYMPRWNADETRRALPDLSCLNFPDMPAY